MFVSYEDKVICFISIVSYIFISYVSCIFISFVSCIFLQRPKEKQTFNFLTLFVSRIFHLFHITAKQLLIFIGFTLSSLRRFLLSSKNKLGNFFGDFLLNFLLQKIASIKRMNIDSMYIFKFIFGIS